LIVYDSTYDGMKPGFCRRIKTLAPELAGSGCNAVKFQKRTINVVYSPEELAKPRESPFGDTNGDL